MLSHSVNRSLCSAVLTALTVVVTGCQSTTVSEAGPATALSSQPVTAVQASAAPVPPVISDWQVIGTSVQGRPIRARTVGNGPRSVLFIGGVHGDEAEGAYTADKLPQAVLDAGLAGAVTLTIVEDANPDGRAAGSRENANGVDINRNFPSTNFSHGTAAYGTTPLSQPESRAIYDSIEKTTPTLIIAMHAWAGKRFVNYDGPAKEIAQRFSATTGLPVEASTEFAATPGSLGSYAGRDRGIPILTVEVLKGTDPHEVWDNLHTALIGAIAG
ncbi:murein peptide amidase A [Mycobacteroides abscessus subsp. abscessus]|nr:murein peptide amidase A [Mycobacteroides abscessus subsp. abscessus]